MHKLVVAWYAAIENAYFACIERSALSKASARTPYCCFAVRLITGIITSDI
jgi:hypothetical protein